MLNVSSFPPFFIDAGRNTMENKKMFYLCCLPVHLRFRQKSGAMLGLRKSYLDYSEEQKCAAHRVLIELVNLFSEYK